MDYVLQVTMRPGATRRYIHDFVDGRRAGIMKAIPGHRGWLWYHNDEYIDEPYHRLHTSVIDTVENNGEDIVITTKNTVYTLRAYHVPTESMVS